MRTLEKIFCGLFSLLIINVHAQQRPNIIIIMADDLGFSDIGSYGGEVNTPNLDKLAQNGLRYKQFYNSARCCPTRAALLTGVYPHQAGMGWMTSADLGTPGYRGDLSKQAVTIAEVLKSAGYGTYMTGKWHLTNERKLAGENKQSLPKQRGFDRYFGIAIGADGYFTPTLYRDNSSYRSPGNFYLTTAISDTGVKFVEDHFQQSKKPMFLYVAYTAPHWPLHALQKDIDKYREMYKSGWDKLRQTRFEKQKQIGLFANEVVMSPCDTAVPAWDELPSDKQTEMAMRMAVYAAQIDAMDQGIGKIIDKLKEKNQLNNTLIFFLSDNGACAELISRGNIKKVDGTAESFESYRIEWANLSSTPFKEYKHYTHEGGIGTPMIAHWPAGIKKNLNNSFVDGYGHITDIMATCLEVSKTVYPAKLKGYKILPLQGKSLVPHFSGKSNNRGAIYFEHEANIAMRDGKWKLVAKTPDGQKFDKKRLELYDMDTDPSEQNNLAAKFPDKTDNMFNSWNEGNVTGVLLLDLREIQRRSMHVRRKINGDFNENLGGWNLVKTGNVNAEIKIDSSGQLTGKKSLHVKMIHPGNATSEISLRWPFLAKEGEVLQIFVNSKANGNTSFLLRLEKMTGNAEKLIDQKINVSTKAARSVFRSAEIPAEERYRIVLDFKGMAAGDEVWIDDVQLMPVKSIKK